MKSSGIYFVLCAIFYALYICNGDSDSNSQSILTAVSKATLAEDGKLNFTQLVIKYGQTVQQYDVVTEDGYILTVFRIPGKKAPVLFLNGFCDSSYAFIIRGDISFVITLAEAGYEVWVGNNRGNLYGRRHVTMNPDTDKMFWDFSFHEIGYYDLPAMIDFVREKTGHDRIFTVAHSQGTTAHFVLTSLRPEYNKRIKLCIALAPAGSFLDLHFPIPELALAVPAVSLLLKEAGIEEIFQNYQVTNDLLTLICSKGILSYLVCGFGFFQIAHFDPKEIDADFFTGVVFGHFPSGTSRKNLEHFSQVYLRRSFAQFDYGADNLLTYGSSSPPEYDLKAVNINMALFAGNGDNLITVKNVERVRKLLPKVVHYEVMEPKQWGHLEFIWGNNTPQYLYPSVLKLLEQYN